MSADGISGQGFVTYTIDASLPVSSVLPLPATTNRNVFTVRWAGADAVGGAGLGGFDIYVSDNGGPWRLWLANTPYWEQLFVGEKPLLEAVVLQRYLAEEISLGRLAELLGLNRWEAEEFLDKHHARLPCTAEMLEQDRRNLDRVFGAA